jgi:hypothetical protein
MPHLVAFAYCGQLSCNDLIFGECLQMSGPEKSDLTSTKRFLPKI